MLEKIEVKTTFLTVDLVSPPSVRHVEFLLAVEEAEGDPAVALQGILHPLRPGLDPVLGTQTGHQQGHGHAREEECHEYHTSPEEVHRNDILGLCLTQSPIVVGLLFEIAGAYILILVGYAVLTARRSHPFHWFDSPKQFDF